MCKFTDNNSTTSVKACAVLSNSHRREEPDHSSNPELHRVAGEQPDVRHHRPALVLQPRGTLALDGELLRGRHQVGHQVHVDAHGQRRLAAEFALHGDQQHGLAQCKGVTQMALENSFDSGELRLLTAGNVVKYTSFDVKEFSILPTQKLRPGETLVAPDAAFDDSKLQVLFSGARYFLKLQSGDLQLFSDFGNGQKQYWSLKHTTIPTTDLSQVTYASIVTNVGGIGLFKSNSALVWTSGKIGIITSNPHNTYFGVDPDGNLRTYALVKGQFWSLDFVAISSVCGLPNSCGKYGVCNNNTCSCLPNWVLVDPKDKTQGCKTLAPFTNCGSGKQRFFSFKAYDYVYNQYATGLKVPVATCQSKCHADCKCLAYFYNANTGTCFLSNEVRTLKKVADTNKSVYIKI